MQDKNDINAMAKKYKEEMMLAYSKKRIGGNPPGTVSQMPQKEEKEHISVPVPAPSPKIKQMEDAAAARSQPQQKGEKDLSHPPMPVIPKMEETKDPAETELSCPPMPEAPKHEAPEEDPGKWKFLTAEELIKKEAEAAPDTSASSETEDPSHHQGNYDFSPVPDKEYESEVEDFKSGHGEGYLQLEVTSGEKDCPVEGAAIAVTRQTDDDMDTLVATLVSGNDGCTDAVTLPANGEKYMVTVYKEGFFTVRDLEVPIFDTIKSIQPVTMTEIGNKV